jgi:class 3 adenylate cyclase
MTHSRPKPQQRLALQILFWMMGTFILMLGLVFFSFHIAIQKNYKKFAASEFEQEYNLLQKTLLQESLMHGCSLTEAIPLAFEQLNPYWLKKGYQAEMLHKRAGPPQFIDEGWIFERSLLADDLEGITYRLHLHFEHFEAMRTHARSILMGCFLLLFLVIFLSTAFVLSRFTRPLRRLVEGAQAVTNGNFSVQVEVQKPDEIGELTAVFNQMVKGLALKDQYRALLDQLNDEAVAQKLLQGEIQLQGEEREATVLFCDIRGFTELSGHIEPHALVEILNTHLSAMAEIAHQHNGVVDKFIGDAIMVIFGSPYAYGQDALHAAQAAEAMMQARATLNENQPHPLHMGIGLSTGKVIAGCVGSPKRRNYTVIGQTVNQSARLCSQAKPDQILLDAATERLIASKIACENLGPVTLKGIENPVPAFQLKPV